MNIIGRINPKLNIQGDYTMDEHKITGLEGDIYEN